MSKVAVIDRCWDCPDCHAVGDWAGKCERTDRGIAKPKEKIPDFCPLPKMPRPLIDVVFEPDSTMDEFSYMAGWNACLDAIIGEEKE